MIINIYKHLQSMEDKFISDSQYDRMFAYIITDPTIGKKIKLLRQQKN